MQQVRQEREAGLVNIFHQSRAEVGWLHFIFKGFKKYSLRTLLIFIYSVVVARLNIEETVSVPYTRKGVWDAP